MAETSEHQTVVTLWYLTTADPAAVIQLQPKADRGFGRKLLAQLNPLWPITPIGQFALNRSAQASKDEFYIAGFPGLSIVQTCLDTAAPSAIPEQLRQAIPAAEVYAFLSEQRTGLGGFAHWKGGALKRSFAAMRERVFEDIGLPEPFEQPYWAGETAEPIGGIALPFVPLELVEAAQRAWLGFDPANANDINVVAYAIDGRPEPKVATPKATIGQVAQAASAKLGLGEQRRDYDDYEEHEEPERELDEYLAQGTSKARGWLHSASSAVSKTWQNIKERVRHVDRP
ncbi:DUF6928 family protein [Corynebacterium pseudopelargi]|uniref:Uncharacterized protein n=1 Tax=Corynebacterium pseudopelargi TaxID=2080757 RepID=A0A3G6IVB2_9CORY|nr:hypothetical protein [Corynebacterium pseudopelargi]AZA09725.1 hypothetical protein CPPEL_08090 [Corynebacterium pseudopelargi]